MSVYWKSRIDAQEPCGMCGRARRDHWGRRSALAPQKLGHQWRPVDSEEADAREFQVGVEDGSFWKRFED
jgi:hypothetical protein